MSNKMFVPTVRHGDILRADLSLSVPMQPHLRPLTVVKTIGPKRPRDLFEVQFPGHKCTDLVSEDYLHSIDKVDQLFED